MINREITYERDINRSYMKIPFVQEKNFDEKIMLRREIAGLLPVEKCFFNGSGQYWYNISGKQALDAYCRVNPISRSFFEGLILRICSQLELLEWNLIDINCLVIDPELIFVNNAGEDISFVLYPQNKGDFFAELQQLMEYLLTKLNHGDKDAVHAAYSIYEVTLTEGYHISDLKNMILEGRLREKKEFQQSVIKETEPQPEQQMVKQEKKQMKEPSKKIIEKPVEIMKITERLSVLYEKAKEILRSKPSDLIRGKKDHKEEIPAVVYPEDRDEEQEISTEVHPTICLAAAFGEPRGILMYEGQGHYPDFELDKGSCVIGKSHKVLLRIDRETISHFHARIEYMDGVYYIEDMNSTNGTYINDVILSYKEKRKLTSGDMLRLADVRYRFL